MAQTNFFSETYTSLTNIDNDQKTQLLLTIILNLENRLSDIEDKFELLQQEYSNHTMKCAYCHKNKLDVKQKSHNDKNFILSCDECYSKIFF